MFDPEAITAELRRNQAVFSHLLSGKRQAAYSVNWLAHDQLHVRQIIRLEYERLQDESGEDLSYAGVW